jgi:glucose-1-phosphate adenylyltransferase
MKKHNTVAMLLAGGQGSRLGGLTHQLAKPAVSFGGKYRIIDFPLSNCRNSKIEVVGVLTQYKPLILNSYISTGAPWALDSLDGGVSILPPYVTMDGGSWYKGTCDAVYQNIEFIDQYRPENVVVLSGDHIYKMNYQDMIEYNDENGGDATIAVMDVTLEEATRFGIMNTDENDMITSFDEKPAVPKSTKASMGVYVFKWATLKKALIEDAIDEESSHDFGKNIIPNLLGEGKKLLAYEFDGYWKDIGTVASYYEANMELLLDEPPFNLSDSSFPVYSNNTNAMPQIIGEDAIVENSLICDGCIVDGTVKNSIVSKQVYIGKDAVVENSIIMHNASIERGVKVQDAVVSEGMVVNQGVLKGNIAQKSNDDIRLLYQDEATQSI